MASHEAHEDHNGHSQGHGHGPHGHGHPHGPHGQGHGHGHGHGPMGRGGPAQFFFANMIITQFFARAWMVVSAVALLKIASSLALRTRIKLVSELHDDLTDVQRDELMADIWRRVERKRMACCPMMSCCSPAEK
jgi:hypothetical protein